VNLKFQVFSGLFSTEIPTRRETETPRFSTLQNASICPQFARICLKTHSICIKIDRDFPPSLPSVSLLRLFQVAHLNFKSPILTLFALASRFCALFTRFLPRLPGPLLRLSGLFPTADLP